MNNFVIVTYEDGTVREFEGVKEIVMVLDKIKEPIVIENVYYDNKTDLKNRFVERIKQKFRKVNRK